jgi:cytochrome oxidase Cu insertion factor (SCO1/SenC/PrrC family)
MMRRLFGAALATGLLLSGCGPEEAQVTLGPKDGLELPPADTGRVKVGDVAPDFSLESYQGEVVTLSDFRGRKDVVLVFYRGHW